MYDTVLIMKITLILDVTWHDCLADAAAEQRVSVNEYLRQMIARDKGVLSKVDEARKAGVIIGPAGKLWGKRKALYHMDDTQHTEVKKPTLPIKVPDVPQHTDDTEVKVDDDMKPAQPRGYIPGRATFTPVPKPGQTKKVRRLPVEDDTVNEDF